MNNIPTNEGIFVKGFITYVLINDTMIEIKLLEDISYNKHNEVHKVDGPAIVGLRKNGTVIKLWYYNGKNYTNEVKHWLCDNMIRYTEMTEDDFDKMWFEIL